MGAQTPSSVARLVITPATREVMAGDTVKFSAQAFDAAGRPVPAAKVSFHLGDVEGGEMDSTGVLIAGSTGVLTASVVALVPGERPKVEKLEIRLVPGPAARIGLR